MKLPGNRKALADLTGAGAHEAIAIVSALVTFPLLFNNLGEEGYGKFAGAIGVAAMASFALAAWIPQWLLEAVLRRERSLDASIASAYGLTVVGTGAGALIALAMSTVLLPDVPLLVVLAVVLGELITAGVSMVAGTVVQLHRSFAFAARFRIWPTLCKPLVCVGLLLAGHLTLRNYVVVLCAAQVLTALTLVVVVHRMCRQRWFLVRPTLRDFQEGLPYAGTMFTWVVQEEADKTLLNTYGHVADAGRYAAAYRVLQMAALPTKAVVSATHHRFLQASTDRPAHEHTRRAVRLSLMVGSYSTVVSLLVFALADLVPVVLGDSFESAVTPLRAICFVLVIRSMTWFPYNALMGLGQHRSRMGVLGATTVTNLGLNVLLIPSMSWQGAVIATYASETVFLTLSWVVLLRARRREAHAPMPTGAGEPSTEEVAP